MVRKQSGLRAVAVLILLGVPFLAQAETAEVVGQRAAAGQIFVAGVKPYQRPASAPVVTDYGKDSAWYAGALSGVEAPYPYSLKFLEDQEGWFDPFVAPGMTGPYDIRGWH